MGLLGAHGLAKAGSAERGSCQPYQAFEIVAILAFCLGNEVLLSTTTVVHLASANLRFASGGVCQ